MYMQHIYVCIHDLESIFSRPPSVNFGLTDIFLAISRMSMFRHFNHEIQKLSLMGAKTVKCCEHLYSLYWVAGFRSCRYMHTYKYIQGVPKKMWFFLCWLFSLPFLARHWSLESDQPMTIDLHTARQSAIDNLSINYEKITIGL